MKFLSGFLVGLLIAGLIGFGYLQVRGQAFQLSGKTITEERSISDFNRIRLSGSGILNLDQGEEEALVISADEKIMKHIITEVVNGELRLEIESPIFLGFFSFPQGEVVYDLKLKDVERVEINGSGKLNSESLTAEKLELIINGSGDVKTGLEVGQVKARISGSGTYLLSGTAEQQEVTISGSGKFFGKELAGSEGKVSINGSGNVETNVANKLEITINGSGKVFYKQTPAMTQSISGSGKIEQLEP